MPRVIGIGLLAAVLAAVLYVAWPSAPPPEEASAASFAPDVAFMAQDGTTRHLHDFKGREIVLHFWASWCLPCIEEFPLLIAMAQRHPEWRLILVSADEDKAAMDRFLQRIEQQTGTLLSSLPNMLLVWDEEKRISQQTFQSLRYPETILIGPDLHLRGKIVGSIKELPAGER